MNDIKFKVSPLEYSAIAKIHGEKVAQSLWARKGHKGDYIHWMVALPGWIETMDGTVMGFKENEQATEMLKEILNDAKADKGAPQKDGTQPR